MSSLSLRSESLQRIVARPESRRSTHAGFDSACERIAAETLPLKGRNLAPITSILARYGQKKASREEVILELYHGSISIAAVNRTARLLWGEEDWSTHVSAWGRKIGQDIRQAVSGPIVRPQTCVFLQGIRFRQKDSTGPFTKLVLVAVGVSAGGRWDILAVICADDNAANWRPLLANLKQRGLTGTAIFVGENDPMAVAAVQAHFPDAIYQGCLQHLKTEMIFQIPPSHITFAQAQFAAMQASDSREEAVALAGDLVRRLRRCGAVPAADTLARATEFLFNDRLIAPSQRRWTGEVVLLKKRMLNLRERMRIIGPINDDESIVLLVAARLRHIAAALQARRHAGAKIPAARSFDDRSLNSVPTHRRRGRTASRL